MLAKIEFTVAFMVPDQVMSADKYYTAVYLKVIYANAEGVTKKYFHRIESTKLSHYFLADQVPKTYQDPVWRRLRNQCKERCNKLIFRNFKFVGDPSTENFYLRHIVDAVKALTQPTIGEVSHVHEIWAKMYPWSDLCDDDTVQKDHAVYMVVEVGADEIPTAVC